MGDSREATENNSFIKRIGATTYVVIMKMSAYAAVGLLTFISVIIAVICFFLIRMGLRYLLQKWKKRWEFYDCKDLEVIKKCAMAGIALVGMSISMVVINLSFIPFRLNVVSWWILISAVIEFLYFYHDRHGF